MIGYDSLGTTLPVMETTVGSLTSRQKLRRTTRSVMTGFDLHEIVTYTLVSDHHIEKAFQPSGKAVALAMPMSEARKYVRTSLMHSVLEVVKYNEAHSNTDAGYFEISKVYADSGEQERLAVMLDGTLQKDLLHRQGVRGDFYAMKGILLAWLAKLGFTASRIQVKENHTDLEQFHPYRSAEIWLDKTMLGVFGDLHPEVLKEYDLTRGVYAELCIDPLFETRTAKVKFEALDRYPAVSRDIALVVKKEVSAKQILDSIRKAGRKLVRSSDVFDVYEGENIGEGMKSVALRIVYQAGDHTLKEEEVSEAHQAILDNLSKQLGASLRV
jgi:phenylalanyl-tRNA synthetase beta chain